MKDEVFEGKFTDSDLKEILGGVGPGGIDPDVSTCKTTANKDRGVSAGRTGSQESNASDNAF
jgi:hypothetical protein